MVCCTSVCRFVQDTFDVCGSNQIGVHGLRLKQSSLKVTKASNATMLLNPFHLRLAS